MSYDYVHETITEGSYVAQIGNDLWPTSPREWDNLGHMLCWHPNYELGDEQFSSPDDVGGAQNMKEVAEYIHQERGGINIIPLYLYDHSGISMSAGHTLDPNAIPDINGRNVNWFDEAGWDTSAVGFMYTTHDLIEKMGTPTDRIDAVLRDEIREYDDFLTGNVWAYTITKLHECGEIRCIHNEVIESVGGFIGNPDDVVNEARSQLASIIAEVPA